MGCDVDFNIFADLLLDKVKCLNIVRVFHGEVLQPIFINLEQNGAILACDTFWYFTECFTWDVTRIYLDIRNFGVGCKCLYKPLFCDEFVLNCEVLHRAARTSPLFFKSGELLFSSRTAALEQFFDGNI
ncbi:hypothetical protein D3C85_1269540 [compost metagenome]